MSDEEPYEHVATLAQALDSILDMITKIRNGDREHIADFQIIAVQKWIDRELNADVATGEWGARGAKSTS